MPGDFDFAAVAHLWPGRPGLHSERMPSAPCKPLDGGAASGEQSALNRAAAAALPRGMRRLPAFEESAGAWRSHTERRTPHTRALRGSDCTHYCEPSPLFEALNARMLQMLLADPER